MQNDQNWSNQTQPNQTGSRIEKKSIAFWQQFMFAFRGPKRYPFLLMQPSGSIVKYFFLLALLVTVLTTAVPVAGNLIGIGGIQKFIQQRIPDFQLKDGVFHMDTTMEYESSTLKLYVDTRKEKYEKKDLDKNGYVQILVSKTNMLMCSGGFVNEYSFAMLRELTFSKKALLKMTPLIYITLVMYLVFSYLAQLVYAMFNMLLFAVIGLFSNQLYQFELRFSQLLTLAMYATTVSVVIGAINIALSLFSGTTVSVVGMIWAAFYFFSSITLCGVLKQQGQIE